jgi:hypothetical protein
VVDLARAADLHCHFGPDPLRTRRLDAFTAAEEAAAAGHRAIVLKSHEIPTALLAPAVASRVADVQVFGGICCDAMVGGLNPLAVEMALRVGAKIVWLPTLTSAQDVSREIARRAGLGSLGEGVRVIDDEARLLAHRVDVLVTHAGVVQTGPNLSAEECGELAELGAYIEQDS